MAGYVRQLARPLVLCREFLRDAAALRSAGKLVMSDDALLIIDAQKSFRYATYWGDEEVAPFAWSVAPLRRLVVAAALGAVLLVLAGAAGWVFVAATQATRASLAAYVAAPGARS